MHKGRLSAQVGVLAPLPNHENADMDAKMLF